MNHRGKKFWIVSVIVALSMILVALPSCKKTQDEPESGASISPAEPCCEEPAKKPSETETEPVEPVEPAESQTEPVEPKGDMVALEIKLPKPMFVGTPTDIRIENLEKPLGKARPPIMAPQGSANVSLEKPITSSDDMPIIGELEQVTDGDKEGVDGSWVELGPGVQWLQIDLEAKCDIYAILIWHYHRQAQVYKDVVVQVADDADFISNVRTLFNNDIDNSAGLGIGKDKHYVETSEGKLVKVDGVKARYVRFYSNGNTSNDQNHYTEVEVYGKPAE
jgi:hypothetical protein